jgi:hypothetical protein
MIDLDGMAERAKERIHRSIGQRARYAKAMLAFEVDLEIDRIYQYSITNRPVFWDVISQGVITSEKIGRRRWDADEASRT